MFLCYMTLRRDDPRWSAFGNGDEIVVAQALTREAAEAVQRLFAPTKLQVWEAKQPRNVYL